MLNLTNELKEAQMANSNYTVIGLPGGIELAKCDTLIEASDFMDGYSTTESFIGLAILNSEGKHVVIETLVDKSGEPR